MGIPSIIKGRYRVENLAGQGGMGSVYRATDLQNSRIVAIKESPEDAKAQKRFAQEADILKNLSHPNLPQVHDFFLEGTRSYMVMDFIEGKTLDKVRDRILPKQQLPVDTMIQYTLQLCDVLEYLHQRIPAIIFLDLKPSNVMVTQSGHVYLIDFGIAHILQWQQQQQPHDTTRFATPGFAAPELLMGTNVDQRTDLYSLGATLHYCLTAHHPQDNRKGKKSNFFNFRPARSYNQNVPFEFDTLIQRLVATKEDKRPRNISEVRGTLKNIQQNMKMNNQSGPNDATVRVNDLFDPVVSYIAQFSAWLVGLYSSNGRLGDWWARNAVPFLVNAYRVFLVWIALVSTRASALADKAVKHMEQGARSSTLSASLVWTPSFLLRFLLLSVVAIGGSAFMLGTLHMIPHMVLLVICITFLILIINSLSQKEIKNTLVRNILTITGLVGLLLCFTIQAQEDVQQVVGAVTLNQAVYLLLLVLGCISFFRPQGILVWIDHATLFTVCSLFYAMQYTLHTKELSRLVHTTSDNYTLINTILLIALVLVAIFAIARIAIPFGRFDAFLVLIVALISAGFYFVPVIQTVQANSFLLALAHLTQPGNVNEVMQQEILLSLPALIAILFFLFFPWVSQSRFRRIPLVLLSLSCAFLQFVHGTEITLPLSRIQPFSFATRLSDLAEGQQFVAYALVILVFFLLCRMFLPFTSIDRVVLFCVVAICALLQYSAWEVDGGSASLSLQNNQLYLIAFNKLVAVVIILMILIRFVVSGSGLLYSLCSHFFQSNSAHTPLSTPVSWGIHVPLGLDRALLFCVVVVCLLLQFFFGTKEPLFASSWNIVGMSIPANLFALGVLGLVALIVLIRALPNVAPNFAWIERVALLIVAIACTLLLFTYQDSQSSTFFIVWKTLPHIVLSAVFIPLALLLLVICSLLWLKRSFLQWNYWLIRLLLGGALVCAFLPLFNGTLQLVALVLLTQSVLLATQIEKI